MWKINRPGALDIVENESIAGELSNYFGVMLNRKLSKSKVASMIEAEQVDDDINFLWSEHERIREEFHEIYNKLAHEGVNKRPLFSHLDLKIKIAEKIIKSCHFCERRCYIDRTTTMGFCCVYEPRIASEFLHMGEEAPLVPSHTIFFTGCTFECVYCQNFDISQFSEAGMKLEEERLAKIIDMRRQAGSRNVNFVGGDPTPNILYILRTMKSSRENIPVIWNSNFYMSEESMKLLDGFIDLFLTDFKYGPGECAERLSGVSNYWNVVTRNHKMAKKAGNMIIRHLVLPNHVECCSKPVMKWILENLGKNTVVNIMGQYMPVYKAEEYEEIARYPHTPEIEEVKAYARSIGLLNLL